VRFFWFGLVWVGLVCLTEAFFCVGVKGSKGVKIEVSTARAA
jgi:hypothetical protein